jgi:glycosyltransferase XagB
MARILVVAVAYSQHYGYVFNPMTTATHHQPIGEWLCHEGLLDKATLQTALEIQQHTGARLGDILRNREYVPRLDFYQTLAKQHGVAFANLLEDVPPASGFDITEAETYLTYGYVPYDGSENISYATFNPDALPDDAEAYVITTPLDIYYHVQQHAHATLEFKAIEYLRADFNKRALTYQPPRSLKRSLSYLSLACAVIAGVVSAPSAMMNGFIVLSNIVFLLCLTLKLSLSIKGASAVKDIKQITHTMQSLLLSDEALPIYTVLIPLYHEADTVPTLLRHLKTLDYPPEKLDIKCIVEADDEATYQALLNAAPPAHYHIIRVPASLPRTKPKACNYALSFAKGELVCIFDAEDRPDAGQLRLCATYFAHHAGTLGALQAPLNYYNAAENLLTRWFSYEYQLLFTVLLPAMYAWHIPIPLGGTSNHVRTSTLRSVGAWDAYNVTEDADLGIRLALSSFITMPIDSITREEAPIQLCAWIKQRSRWIKGYFQSWAVMSRSTNELYHARGLLPLCAIHIFVGLSSLAYVIVPLLWANVAWHGINGTWNIIGIFSLLTGLFGIAVQYNSVLLVQRMTKNPIHAKDIVALLTFPFYFVLHSVAALKALAQLVYKPYYWEKTMHHRSRFSEMD